MPARSIDQATISFGLVSIPVKIYSTGEPSHELHFHFVHEGCGQRVQQRYACPEHGELDRQDMVKGFELSRGKIVELDKAELDALAAVSNDEIAVTEFVPAEKVDPILVAKSYYLGPGKGGDRAYRLLRDAIEDSGLVAIATYNARGKMYVVVLRPFEDGLVMHQLRYLDEVKPWSEVPHGRLPKPAASELVLARRVIEQLEHAEFDPSRYEDEVKARVRQLIVKKARTGEITVPQATEAERPEVGDLMAALEASLGGEPRGARKSDKRSARAKRASTKKRRAPRRAA